MTKVFISYSHDSDAHRQRVLALSYQSREDSVDCYINATGYHRRDAELVALQQHLSRTLLPSFDFQEFTQ